MFLGQIVAVFFMQATKHQARGHGGEAQNHKGDSKGRVGVAHPGLLIKKAQAGRANGNAKTDGQLLIYSHEAIATAGLMGPKVGQRDRVHGGKLNRVRCAHDEQQRNEVIQGCFCRG